MNVRIHLPSMSLSRLTSARSSMVRYRRPENSGCVKSTYLVTVIYGVHNQQERNFMVEVKAILARLAETLVVLRKHLPLDFHAPTQPLSRDAATLHLLLHQVCRLQQKKLSGGSWLMVGLTVCYFNRPASGILAAEAFVKHRFHGRNLPSFITPA